jgi:hypothetical protein
MLPACCLSLWGREGVTLIAAAENYSNDFEKEGFNRAEHTTLPSDAPIKHHDKIHTG